MRSYTLKAEQAQVDLTHAAIASAMKAAPNGQTMSALARLMVWLEDQIVANDGVLEQEGKKEAVDAAIAERAKSGNSFKIDGVTYTLVKVDEGP